ncbi:MAG: M23 family metallopeptidase [Spirochaetaceae bacterium]|jgi:murein DD-endopeptidase MepM/ murein hydrolase activator NlpD|nr:M23 family metallopeptidase [Spirochaetaceae bacterium]
MVNNYTHVLKSQHVERREPSLVIRPKMVLKSKQNLTLKRVSPFHYQTAGNNIPHNETSSGEMREESFHEKPQGRQKEAREGSFETILDAVRTVITDNKEPDIITKRSMRRWVNEESPRLHKDAAAPAAEEVLPASSGGLKQAVSEKTFSQFMLIIFACIVLGFFIYNALLWQSDADLLKPVEDTRIRSQLFEFASGSGVGSAAEETVLGLQTDNLPVNTSETFEWQYYTVKKGDSVSKIAADHILSMDAVIASNNMKNARMIKEGDVLRIPNMNGIPYTVVQGDTYEEIAERFGVPLNAILDANDIQSSDIFIDSQLFIPGAKMRSEDLKMALGELFIYPIRGRLTSSFGWRKDPFTGERRYHNAIDLAANTGTPVKATRDGKVTTVGFSPVFGKYIIISHNGDYQSLYAHLNLTSIVQGARVTQGEKIGEAGSTGHSTGPHLHFAIYKNGRAANPLELLKL